MYGDLTYSPIPSLKVTGGLRESYATSFLTQTLPPVYFNQGAPLFEKATNSFNSLVPKVTIEYAASADTSVYVSAGKGNRLGGENYYVSPSVCAEDLHNIGLTSAPTSYGTDSLWSYEGGLKGRFFNDTLSINADGYYVKWSNIQQTITLPICGEAAIANIGNAVSYGPELEVNYKPLAGLTLGVSASHTHAVITSINPNDVTLGVSVGQAVLNVPEWMAALRVDYNHPVSDDIKGFVRADYDFTGPSFGAFSASAPDYVQPEYSVMNASFGLNYKQYEISVFAKNLLNSSKIIQIPSLLFTPEAYTLRPLTAGVLVKAKF